MQESTRGAIMGGLGKGKKVARVHAVHVRRAASGGFIVRHEGAAGGGPGKDGYPEEHVMPDMAALQAHMQGALGDGDGDEGGGIPPAAGGGQE